MLYPTCYSNECIKNEYFLNTKKFFKAPARQTLVEKVASVFFLIYALALDIANIAKRPFTRKVTIEKASNEKNIKKHSGYTLLAFSALAIYGLKKYLESAPFNKIKSHQLDNTINESLPGLVDQVSDPIQNGLLTDSFRNISNNPEITGLLFGFSFLFAALALRSFKLKPFENSEISSRNTIDILDSKARLTIPEISTNNFELPQDLSWLFSSGAPADSSDNLAPPLASSVIPKVRPPKIPEGDPQINISQLQENSAERDENISIGGNSLSKIEECLKNHIGPIFFPKLGRAGKENSFECLGPKSKSSLGYGAVFAINGLNGVIFKIRRHTTFKMKRMYKKTPSQIQAETKSGTLIDVVQRGNNIKRCKQIIKDHNFDSIVLPKTISRSIVLSVNIICSKGCKNPPNGPIKFPILIQEKLKFEKVKKKLKKGKIESPLTLEEALKTEIISEESFRQFVKFLLISGFKDVRDDNILIVKEGEQYKIGIIDFDDLNCVETAILGSKEINHDYGGREMKKIPGLLGILEGAENSSPTDPAHFNKYLDIVRTIVSDFKKEFPESSLSLAKIEAELNLLFFY